MGLAKSSPSKIQDCFCLFEHFRWTTIYRRYFRENKNKVMEWKGYSTQFWVKYQFYCLGEWAFLMERLFSFGLPNQTMELDHFTFISFPFLIITPNQTCAKCFKSMLEKFIINYSSKSFLFPCTCSYRCQMSWATY